MLPLSRRSLLLALLGGSAALASCSLPSLPPPPPSPTPRPTPTATPPVQRITLPTTAPRPLPATPTLGPNDPLLRARQLLYSGEHAGQRGLIASKGDGSEARLVAAGHFGPATWSPDGQRFLVAGAVPGEERLAPQAWLYHEHGVLVRSHRLEGLQDTFAWAPDSLRVAVVATRRDARATPDRAYATYLLNTVGEVEVAIGQQTRPLGWTPLGRLVLTVTDRLPTEDPEYAPRALWTTSVGGSDWRQVAEGYSYVGLVGNSEAVYALGGYRLYHLPSRPSVERPTRLAILDIRTGQETLSITADEIAASGPLSSPTQLPYWFGSASVSPRGDQIALWLVPQATDTRSADTIPALLAIVGQDGTARWIKAVPVSPLPAAPVWSSRTDALAYPNGPENIRDPESAAVYLRTADGRITTLPSADITSFGWSPDGAWVAYTRQQHLLLTAATDAARTYPMANDGRAPRWRPV